METTTQRKLSPDKLGNTTAVMLWQEEAEANIGKQLADELANFDLEHIKAADAKKQLIRTLRMDRALATYQGLGAGLVRTFVDIGQDDPHNLLRTWRTKAEALTAALPQGQPLEQGEDYEATRKLAPRLAHTLMTALLEFLCLTIRAESAEIARQRGEQERLARVIKEGIRNGKVEEVKGLTSQFLLAKCELFGQKAAVTMIDDLQSAMSTELWAGMPGFSLMEEQVKKLAVAVGDQQIKAEQASLIETMAKWAGDAARKLPEKKVPSAPALQKGREPVKLACDKPQPLWETYSGCGECSSLFHKRADHKQELGAGGGKGGTNGSGGGGGNSGGKKPKAGKFPCLNCDSEDHVTVQCTNAKCNACGAKGHWAAKCTEKQGAGKTKEPTAPATTTHAENQKGNKNPEIEKYSVIVVEGEVNGKPVKVGLDTFCAPDTLIAHPAVAGHQELHPSQVTLEGVGSDVKPLGHVKVDVTLTGGAKFEQIQAEVLETLPGGVDVLIGGGPLAEQGLFIKSNEVRVAEKCCKRVTLGAVQKTEVEQQQAMGLEEVEAGQERQPNYQPEAASETARKEWNSAKTDLEANVQDFVSQRRAGRVQGLELGADGKMYAYVDGEVRGVEVHGNFYRDENTPPQRKMEKPKPKRYKGGTTQKIRVGSRMGDVPLTKQQEQAWDAERRAKELEVEQRLLEEKRVKLQEEQDVWEAAVAAVKAKGTPEGAAAMKQDDEEETILEELEQKLEELEQARKAGANLTKGRYMAVAAADLRKALGPTSGKMEVAAAVQRAVNEAIASGKTQHVEVSRDQAIAFLRECTEEADKQPAAPSVPKTARAAEVVSGTDWEKRSSGEIFGGEGAIDSERVDLNEFCFPEPEEKLTDERLEEHIKGLLAKSKLETVKARERYVRIMKDHKEAFCTGLKDFKPGQVDAPKLKLHVTPGPPVRQARRQLSPDKTKWLAQITVQYDNAGIWETPTEEMWNNLWISNPVIPEQPDKENGGVKFRLTVDFAGPNSRIEPYPGHSPLCEELASLLQGAVLIDKDDGISGYFQVALHPDSKHLTGVYTPLGVRVFNVMPLGINVAPTTWNELMAGKFGDLGGTFTLMDDVLRFTKPVPGETREQLEMRHLDLLQSFLDRVVAAKLRLKLPKSVHAVEELEALGMIYNGDTMRKTEWTYSVLRDYKTPTGPKQMQRFLALGQYYAKYTEGYAKLVAPLRRLERKQRWSKDDMAPGTPEHDLFLQIKERLTEDVRLALPDWSREFIIKSDFSNTAMGGALLQEDKDGKIRPIAYVSRKCVGSEEGAHAPDGELLALVWVVQRFEKFLIGKRFKAYVDQASLHWLHDKELSSINNKRLQGAFAYLRQFQFDLFYRKAAQMQDVDALSRVVAAAWSSRETHCWETWEDEDTQPAAPTTAKQQADQKSDDSGPGVAQVELEGVWGFETKMFDIDALQAEDDEVKLIRAIRNGADYTKLEAVPAAFSAINAYRSRDVECAEFVEGGDGRLYHLETINGEVVRQLYVPLGMRGRLVVTQHGSAAGGHRAEKETLAKLRKQYFWASMSKDVHGWLEGCGCKRKKGERAKRVGELSGLKLMRPGEKIIFDFMKLPLSLSGNKYLLVIVDVGSREIALEALPTKETEGVAKAIMNRVYLRGKSPRVWQSDNAKEFTSKVMIELAKLLGAKFKHSSPYHPQTNTHVERYNKTIATHLSLLVERADQRDWDEYLRFVEYANLVGAQAVLGRISPMFLNGGWDALDPLDRVMQSARDGAANPTVSSWMEKLARARTIAMQSQKLAGADSRKRRDIGAVKLDVDVGDEVWVMFPNVRKGRSRKLAFRMHGTYVVREWLHGEKRVAILEHKDDANDTVLAHVDRMVRKKEVPKALRDQWKPIRMELANPQGAHKATDRDKKELVESGRLKVAPAGEEEVFDQDGAFEIERILDHAVDNDGVVQFKVRYVGFGPDEDLWYDEKDLVAVAPDIVASYREKVEEKLGALGGSRKEGVKKKVAAKSRRKKPAAQSSK